METGWLGAEEPQEPGVGGFAGFILANRAAPDTGRTVGDVLARAALARDREPEPVDPDDRMASLVTRGYRPGLLGQLAQQVGDATAELEAEREKIEKGKRRQEFAAREHAAGRVDVFRMQAMLDGDLGDEGRVAMLERRVQRLNRQISETQEMITPPVQRSQDPVESATRRAHEAFIEVTRQRMAEAAQSRPAPRPFAGAGSVSRGRSTEHVPDGYCWVCEEGHKRDAARAREDYAAVYGEIAQ